MSFILSGLALNLITVVSLRKWIIIKIKIYIYEFYMKYIKLLPLMFILLYEHYLIFYKISGRININSEFLLKN